MQIRGLGYSGAIIGSLSRDTGKASVDPLINFLIRCSSWSAVYSLIEIPDPWT